jgi:hypothetical protein
MDERSRSLDEPAGSARQRLLSYSEALSRLRERFPDLTDGEMAMWVSNNWLTAFDRYGDKCGVLDFRSRDQLRECRFDRDEIDRCQPDNRYLTFAQLCRRWQPFVKDPAGYIRNKAIPLGETAEEQASHGGRVFYFHGFDPFEISGTPLEDCLFSLEQIIKREKEEFPVEGLEQIDDPNCTTVPAAPEPETVTLLNPGDPYSRLKREVPDAETLDRLLAPIVDKDRWQWVRDEAIAAMEAKQLYPSVLLGDQRWRCSRQAFKIWIRKLSKDTGWPLPAFWADEPSPESAPSESPAADRYLSLGWLDGALLIDPYYRDKAQVEACIRSFCERISSTRSAHVLCGPYLGPMQTLPHARLIRLWIATGLAIYDEAGHRVAVDDELIRSFRKVRELPYRVKESELHDFLRRWHQPIPECATPITPATESLPEATHAAQSDHDKPAPTALRQITRALERYGESDAEPPESMKKALSRVRELMKSNGLDELAPYTAAKRIEEFAILNKIEIAKDPKTIVGYLKKASKAEFR